MEKWRPRLVMLLQCWPRERSRRTSAKGSRRSRTSMTPSFLNGTNARAEKEAAEEAKRREDATMAAHMSWSTRPAKKKLRISLDVRSGRTTRYSEIEVPDGEVVTIALQAAIVEGGEEFYHRGKRMDAKEVRPCEKRRSGSSTTDQVLFISNPGESRSVTLN